MFCRKVMRLLKFFFLSACFSCSLITNVYATSVSTPSDYVDDDVLGDDVLNDDVSLFSNPLELPDVSDEDLKEELGFNQPKPEPASGHVSLFSVDIRDKYSGGKLFYSPLECVSIDAAPKYDDLFFRFKGDSVNLTRDSYFLFEFKNSKNKSFIKRLNFVKDGGSYKIRDNVDKSAFNRVVGYKIHLGKSNLPKPGKYCLRLFMSNEVGDCISIDDCSYYVLNLSPSVRTLFCPSYYLSNTSQFGAFGNISINKGQYGIDIVLRFSHYDLDIIDHGFTVAFTPYEPKFGFADPSTGVKPGTIDNLDKDDSVPNTSNDVVEDTRNTADNTRDTADNTKAIVESQNLILGTLKAIIQHISDQLFAFWNQLAGEFTNLYAKLEKNANDNFTALKEAGKAATEHIVENNNNNTNELKENNDKNTDKALNSYDNSSMNSDNERLRNKLAEQDEFEDLITSSINEPLSSFEFKNPVNQYLLAFGMCGRWLQKLFDSLGGFKDVVNLSFAMTIALICIGMYRFKGGV